MLLLGVDMLVAVALGVCTHHCCRLQTRRAVERANAEVQSAHTKALQVADRAAADRAAFETRMTRQCEVLIQEVQTLLAERLTSANVLLSRAHLHCDGLFSNHDSTKSLQSEP